MPSTGVSLKVATVNCWGPRPAPHRLVPAHRCRSLGFAMHPTSDRTSIRISRGDIKTTTYRIANVILNNSPVPSTTEHPTVTAALSLGSERSHPCSQHSKPSLPKWPRSLHRHLIITVEVVVLGAKGQHHLSHPDQV